MLVDHNLKVIPFLKKTLLRDIGFIIYLYYIKILIFYYPEPKQKGKICILAF